MADRLAEAGAVQYALENTGATGVSRLGGAGQIQASYSDYETWLAANPSAVPSTLTAKGRIFSQYKNSIPAVPTDPYFANVVSLLHFEPVEGEDPYFGSTTLLMHMDGTDNGTTFTDVKGKAVTRVGTPVTKTAEKKFGTASAYFDGTGDYLTLADTTDLEFGSGNFTVEMWFNPSTVPPDSPGAFCLIGKMASSGSQFAYALIYRGAGDRLRFEVSTSGTGSTHGAQSNGSFSAGTWYHVAVVRSGATLTMYIDGVAQTITADLGSSSLFGGTASVIIGDYAGETYGDYHGYIDEIRVTKGVARYTGNFTPQTAAFPDVIGGLTDVKSNTWTAFGNASATGAPKYGSNALSVDGVGDWINTPYNVGWNFGADNFTVELWFNSSSTNQYASLLSADNGALGWSFLLNSVANDGKIAFYENVLAPSLLVTTVGGYNDSQWHHVALVRNGTNVSIYVDGTSRASLTSASSTSLPGALYIGGSVVSASRALTGLVDEVRITKGIARYTANFTPPTAAFPDA